MSDCTCCTGVEVLTPGSVENRAGLSAIVYRVGEHGSFFESMLASLSLEKEFGFRSRETDDFPVALLDAASIVLDIVTFYQERLANEHYLRTATERQSVAGLGQLPGYRLRPGRAGATHLAFTLEPRVSPLGQVIPGVPSHITIPIGTKVQSVPGPDEKPQIFETVEVIEARPDWNAIPLRFRARHVNSAAEAREVELVGLVNGVRNGDTVLLKGLPGHLVVKKVQSVEPTQDQKLTRVILSSGSSPVGSLGALHNDTPSGVPPALFDDAYIANHIRSRDWKQAELESLVSSQRWNADDFTKAVQMSNAGVPSGLSVVVLGVPAALFGHNAREFPKTLPSNPTNPSSSEFIIVTKGREVTELSAITDKYATSKVSDQAAGTNTFDLDNTYAAAVPGRVIILQDDSVGTLVATIESVSETSVFRFELTGRVSRIVVGNTGWLNQVPGKGLGDFRLRNTRLYIETAQFPALPPRIEQVPGYQSLSGSSLLLDGPYLGLKAGRAVIVTGELANLPGQNASELVTLAETKLEDGYTRLHLTAPLRNRFMWSTVRVLANVAASTHGETVSETLGSGDAREAFQRFRLKQPPLTWVSAITPEGVRPELTVRVNGIEWQRIDNLYEAGPQDTVYILHVDGEGQTYVVFGDGRNGARLPSGAENVTAVYRRGLGKGGLLKAGQLTLPLSRPLGLKEVNNPLVPTGAGDPETIKNAKRSLAFPLRTLGRIVTLQDYEDFARASSGVAKSSAHWIWNGQRWIVLVTIAAAEGEPLAVGSPAFNNLLQAMRDAGDPLVSVTLAQYEPRYFDVNAGIVVNRTFQPDLVLADTKARLLDEFSFDRRAFAQPVILSEVISVLQSTPGVVAVDVNALFLSSVTPDLSRPPDTVIPASGPVVNNGVPRGAELITVDRNALRGLVVQVNNGAPRGAESITVDRNKPPASTNLVVR